ncbi:MAG: universal stress protein [Gemmatimonadales bacterium]
MRSILIPLDGSAFSATAVPMAVKLARAAGARVKLVRVHEPFLALVPAVEVPVPAPPDDAELRKQEETHLAETAAALGVVGPSKVEHELLVGLAANALTEAIERDRPDLVVMSTHGRGPLSRFWLGSVADHLVRHVSVPLLLLRPSEDEKAPAEPAIRSILVPLDLSGSAESILGPVTELAQITRAKVTLLHVLELIRIGRRAAELSGGGARRADGQQPQGGERAARGGGLFASRARDSGGDRGRRRGGSRGDGPGAAPPGRPRPRGHGHPWRGRGEAPAGGQRGRQGRAGIGSTGAGAPA